MKWATHFAVGLVVTLLSATPARAQNYVEVILTRLDDVFFPNEEFLLEVFLQLEVAGVTDVNVMAGSRLLTLEDEGDGEWSEEDAFTSFASMTAALDGTWTVTIAGSFPSVSSFTLDASSFMDSDFLQTPTNLMPANGTTGVPADVTLSWTPPPGGDSAYILVVIVGSEIGGGGQEDNSLDGTLSITDTMWTPPLPLSAGLNEWDVIYANVDESFVTDLSVDSGSIAWGTSPFAPPTWPPSRPLLALGADTIGAFTVPEPSVVLLQLAALGALGGIAGRRRAGRRERRR